MNTVSSRTLRIKKAGLLSLVMMSAAALSISACQPAATDAGSDLTDNTLTDNTLTDNAATDVSFTPPETMKDWIVLKEAEIKARREYLAAMKAMASGVSDREAEKISLSELEQVFQTGSATLIKNGKQIAAIQSAFFQYYHSIEEVGFSLTDASDYATTLQALNSANEHYLKMSNMPIEFWVANEKGYLQNMRIGLDNEGVRVANLGKMTENEAKRLDNVLKDFEIILKQNYSIGYQHYTRAYLRYADVMRGVWAQVGQVSDQIGNATAELNKYRRKMAICESQVRRIQWAKNNEAIQELQSRDVRWRTIPQIMQYLAGDPKGEQCLHRVLLGTKWLDTSELHNIGYDVTMGNGKKVSIECPSNLDVSQGMDAMDYPMPLVDPKTYEVSGYYQPLTYYQLYRMVTDNEASVRISPPMSKDMPLCRKHDPEIKAYQSASLELESALAEGIVLEVDPGPSGDHGFAAETSSIPLTNPSYRKLVQRFATIFDAVESCRQSQNGDLGAAEVAGTPFQAGPAATPVMPATSNINVFFDPAFPKMSETIRSCAMQAEHHRYRTFAQLEPINQLLEVMKKATELKPPRAPHPTQFQPALPATDAGNDF